MMRAQTSNQSVTIERCRYIFFIVFLFSFSLSGTAQKFTTVGKDIIDPCGSVFFPVGANLNGPNWVWASTCKGGADRYKDVWNFNTVRLNMALKSGLKQWPTYPQGGNMWDEANLKTLDEIIIEYTSKNIVVQLELHDWTGLYPSGQDLIDLENWWKMIATKYDGNEYVWFNLFNEPGGHQANPVSVQYRDVHRILVEAIRDEAGSDNMIVIDGAAFGQDVGGTYNSNLVEEQRSGILLYGNDIKNFNNKTYQNISFAIHVYGQWGFGTDQQRAAKMIDYIDRVHAKGLQLHIGELGYYCDNATAPEALGSITAYQVAPNKGVGILAWHGQPGDGFALPSCSVNGNILSHSSLPALSWSGELLVPIAKARGSVACSGGSTPDTENPSTPSDLVSTGKTTNSVSLMWNSSTDNVGVTGYDIFIGTTKVNTSPIHGTTYTVTGLSPSTTYNFTVRARDAAGNLSTFSNSISVTTNDIDRSIPLLELNDHTTGTGINQFEFVGTWNTSTGAAKYNQEDHYTSTTGAYYQVRFYGTQVNIFTSLASHHGIAAVSIDGGPEVMVDLYAATRSDNSLAYESPVLSQGEHIIKVRASGTKNPSSTGTVIVADRIQVLNQSVVTNIASSSFSNLSVYPNPTSGIVYINAENNVKVKVSDAYGKIILEGKFSEVNLAAYPSGVYFMELNNGNKVSTVRIVKH